VAAFHAAELPSASRYHGSPRLRDQYISGSGRLYYAAFLLDPDGNNVEAVCHKPA